jgi:hypothetical protein
MEAAVVLSRIYLVGYLMWTHYSNRLSLMATSNHGESRFVSPTKSPPRLLTNLVLASRGRTPLLSGQFSINGEALAQQRFDLLIRWLSLHRLSPIGTSPQIGRDLFD